jgi:hypothetical protein
MEGEYESEIAKRVAGKMNRGPSKKAGVLLSVAAAFALLSGTAAIALAMNESPTGMPPLTEYVLYDRVQDKLIADDDSTVALRVMNLKVKGDHETAGDTCTLQDAKFNYVLKATILDAGMDWAGMELGRLALPFDHVVSSAKVVVLDSLLAPVDVDAEVAFVTDDAGLVTVSIPSLADGASYGVDYTISITIVIDTTSDLSEDLSGVTLSEVAWGDDAAAKFVTIP